MTFYEYVCARRKTDTPEGDFCGDVRRDFQFKKDIASKKELIAYLECRLACDEAIAAARKVWAAYQRKLKSTYTSQ